MRAANNSETSMRRIDKAWSMPEKSEMTSSCLKNLLWFNSTAGLASRLCCDFPMMLNGRWTAAVNELANTPDKTEYCGAKQRSIVTSLSWQTDERLCHSDILCITKFDKNPNTSTLTYLLTYSYHVRRFSIVMDALLIYHYKLHPSAKLGCTIPHSPRISVRHIVSHSANYFRRPCAHLFGAGSITWHNL